MTNTPRDLARTTLAVLFIVGLIAASFWIMRPFLFALIWATMIVVATWPLMLRAQAWLWQRRWIAVAVMTTALLLVVVNYAPNQSQCYARLPFPDLAGRTVQFKDLMSPASYERHGDDLLRGASISTCRPGAFMSSR
ncbi:MAG: hypothetical protein ACREU0_00835 [Burkholderiales bacterium]